jgi:hypothetical protein
MGVGVRVILGVFVGANVVALGARVGARFLAPGAKLVPSGLAPGARFLAPGANVVGTTASASAALPSPEDECAPPTTIAAP